MKSFFIALQFLSRIHVVTQTVWTEADFGRSVIFFPLVGTVIGAVLCLAYAGISLWVFPALYGCSPGTVLAVCHGRSSCRRPHGYG
mgnify:CR=1 FL=1